MLAKRNGIKTRNEGKVPLSVGGIFLGPLGAEEVFKTQNGDTKAAYFLVITKPIHNAPT